MTTIEFLAQWAIRSSALIACGAALLWALRVKDASIRLTAWTAILAASLAIPALRFTFPQLAIPIAKSETRSVEAPATVVNAVAQNIKAEPLRGRAFKLPPRFDWPRAALAAYSLVGLILLLRLCIGLAMSRRLLRGSLATNRTMEGIPILESGSVAAPVTLGIVRPAIVLPPDWREWDEAKLNAVLAHERSHILRSDPAVQLLSAIHRALLWHSPLSWFLHLSILRAAEEASDDAAVGAAGNRTFYAEVLLEFMQRRIRRMTWFGVPMARYGRGEKRIHRILDGASLSRGMTRGSIAAIMALVLPLAYVVATVRESQAAPQIPAAAQHPPAPAPAAAPPANAAPRRIATPKNADAPKPADAPVWLNGLGTVTATTLVVTSRVDGELKSLGFEEGKPVEAGQLLATIAPQNVRAQLDQAERDLRSDVTRLNQSAGQPAETVVTLESQVKADQREIDNLQRALAYGQIRAPFAGVAGLHKVDPGNFVRTGDALVVIAQLQPIAVVFNLPEDTLPDVLRRVRDGENPSVEAWNRNATVKLATGRLTAVDNQIDKTNGTVVLKAMFENKDGALFPNQFVNVRLLLKRQI